MCITYVSEYHHMIRHIINHDSSSQSFVLQNMIVVSECLR